MSPMEPLEPMEVSGGAKRGATDSSEEMASRQVSASGGLWWPKKNPAQHGGLGLTQLASISYAPKEKAGEPGFEPQKNLLRFKLKVRKSMVYPSQTKKT